MQEQEHREQGWGHNGTWSWDYGFGDSFAAKWPWPLPLLGPEFPYLQTQESTMFSQQCFFLKFLFSMHLQGLGLRDLSPSLPEGFLVSPA